jgi:chemosensory pili system protein ChpE
MGGGLLAWLGIRTLYRIGPATIPTSASHVPSGDLMAGAALSLANPQSVAYWMALGSGLKAILAHVPTQRDYTVFFAGFMLACLPYCCLAAGLIVGIRRALTDRWYRSLNVLCGLALLAFALMLAYGTLETLLHE